MKKLWVLILSLCIALSIGSCSKKTVYACLSFSEYYQSANDFDEISPCLESYFSFIETAYENSDKKTLSSFVLPEEYDEVCDTLQSFYESLEEDYNGVVNAKDDISYTTAEEAYMSKLRLLYPYVQIKAMMAERDLMLIVSPRAKDEDWFEELNTLVKDAVKEYLVGTGE